MQNERIYSAPSLSEVCKQLLIYRPTGVLTIWRAPGPRQEEARITIERGRLLSIYWGSYKEHVNDSMLGWLNSWGAIHFTFLATEIRLQLPAPSPPSPPSHQEHPVPSTSSTSPEPRMKPAVTRRLPAVTQPLQAMPTNRSPHVSSVHNGQQQGLPLHGSQGRISETPLPYEIYHEEERSHGTAQHDPAATMTPEALIATPTQNGRIFPAANLPRYDRTIFLLINGRRSIADLSQLTKRSLEEIYSTLLRLRNMQLITIEAQSTQMRDK